VNLAEKYRPQTYADVIGQASVIATIDRLRPRGLGGRSWWIWGHRGQGKTSIAELLASELASDLSVKGYNGAELTEPLIQDLEKNSGLFGFGDKHGRAFIVDEAHRLTTGAVGQLLTTLETGNIPKHVIWIFTTTEKGQAALLKRVDDAAPLIARSVDLKLTSRGLCELFAKHCKRIAEIEELDGRPIGDYERLAKSKKNDCRAMLQAVEQGAMLPDSH